jgi:DNA-binding LacI/PurR family transcriptional regulator
MAKYQDITADLQQMIEQGRLRPGDRLPTVGELRQRYQVSHITIVRVFKELTGLGLIEALSGSGYAVRKIKTLHRTGTIANFNRPMRPTGKVDNFLNDINIHLQMECFSRGLDIWQSHTTRPLNVRPVSDAALTAIIEAMLEAAPRVDGFLVDEFIPDSRLEPVLEKTAKPMVVINRRTVLPIDSVTPPNREGMAALVAMALKMGYRNFVFCTQNAYSSNFEERSAAFQVCVQEQRLEQVEYIRWDSNSDILARLDATVLPKVKRGERPLLVCISDYAARHFANWALGHGLVFGRDLGIFSFDGFDMAVETPELTTIKSQPDKLGSLAVELLQQRIAGENTESPGNYTSEVLVAPGSTI